VLVETAAMPNKHGIQVVMPVDDKSNREKEGTHGPSESYPPSNCTKDRATGQKQWRRQSPVPATQTMVEA
jgi:hypothetical protein